MSARLVSALAADRAPREAVIQQARLFAESPAAGVLNRLPQGVAVFNAARQIVYANEKFCELAADGRPAEELLGLRLGEALSCLGARLEIGGCGTSEMCRSCGAACSIATTLRGQNAAEGECSIAREGGQRLERLDFRLRIWALPYAGERFHAAILTDTRAERRLALMERIFYHDILNIVSGMQGVCEMLREGSPPTENGELDLLLFAAERVTDIIHSQRDFSLAERGQYELTADRIDSGELLEEITALMRREPSCRTKNLAIAADSAETAFTSDRKLVTRILVNMQKNALEATPPDGKVTTGCILEDDGGIRLWVHNDSIIPEEAQSQIFRRTFSTKGAGRGLGTYGMKLFAENYLGGTVGFTTSPTEGTTFFVRLPATLPTDAA